MEKLTPAELKSNLHQFIGSEEFHRYKFFGKEILLTEGIYYLAENAGCYWFLDIIMSVYPKWQNEDFVSVKMTVENQTAKVVIDDGNGRVLYQQSVGYTDFPLSEIMLYLTGGVLMLTSEY